MTDRILVVCTANICRSPMAEVLLRHAAHQRGIDATVASAGVRARGGLCASEGSAAAMSALGHRLDDHRSRAVDDAIVDAADLVVAMEARHVVDLVGGRADRFARTFTLRELVERAHRAGERGERPLQDWLDEVGAGRHAAALVGAAGLDVDDPYGGAPDDYRRCAAELVGLVGRLADELWGPPPFRLSADLFDRPPVR